LNQKKEMDMSEASVNEAMKEKVRDETMPEKAWKFDEAVTDAFEDMLQRSIPQHDLMRELCFKVGCRFVRPKTAIVDLGCSRGGALAAFVEKFGALNRYVGVEVSEPMLAAARERFRGFIDCGVAEVRNLDLRTGYPPAQASLTLCILTLQFTPIEHRQRIVRDAFRSTVPGGALVLVEKVIGSTAETDALLNELYWGVKAENGYTRDQIERKRLSLEGVLVPVTARWNEELLASAGFRAVECFWRTLNFSGWVAIKE
jgi:tRNA (cmo5U34)-methyltransferase